MGDMNAAQLHYVEVMCQSIIHGMYCVLVAVVIWLLMTPRPMPMIHKVMFWAGIVMWVLASIFLGLVIQQVTKGTTPLRNAQAQVLIATVQFMIGDMILIWRVWAVWGRNCWVTVIPIMLMIAAAVVRIALVASTARVLAFVSDVSSEIIVANTLLCTVLIVGRIWYMQWQINKLLGRALSRRSQNTYKAVIILIIESGALYALAQLLNPILDDARDLGIHTVLDMQVPLIGMLPTLIVLVVHFDLTQTTKASERYTAAVLTNKFQAAPRNDTTNLPTIREIEPRRSIEIELETNHEYETDISDSRLQHPGQGDMV